MDNDDIFQLLFISDKYYQANQVLSLMREQGHSIRSNAVSNESEFIEVLPTSQWDIIICFEHSRALAISNLFKLLKKQERNIPVIVLTDEGSLYADGSQINPLAMLKLGAKAVLKVTDNELLVLAICREIKNYRVFKKNLSMEISLRELEQRYQVLVEGTDVAISYINEGMHIYCNQSYSTLFDFPDKKLITTTPFLELLSQTDSKKLKKLLSTQMHDETKVSIQGKRHDGSIFNLEMTFTPIEYKGESCLQVSAQPSRGNAAYAIQKKQIATQDLLTSLYNKSAFLRIMEIAIAKAIKQNLFSSLLIVQVNEVLDIESSIGKSNTNFVLADISQFLQDSIKKPFIPGRLDSFEFGLILYDDDPEEAHILAEFIKSKINNRITTTSLSSLDLSCSVGFAAINGNALDAEDIVARAKSNLSDQLKPDDRKQAENFAYRINESSKPRTNEMLNYIDNALDNDLFTLLFQPIVNLKNESSADYEVLLRMLDTEGNEILPVEFIPVANMGGLGEKLDKWVIHHALEQLQKEQNPDIRLSINITNNGLISRTFLPWVSEELKSNRTLADKLIFLISEIDLHNNLDYVINFCNSLEELNLKKSVTHFGCALEPFKHLNSIQLDYVILDETLIRDIIYSEQQKNHVSTLIEELHQLQLKVVAPRIENMDALPVFWQIGIDYVQGYCVQAPSQEMNYQFIKEQEITLRALPG